MGFLLIVIFLNHMKMVAQIILYIKQSTHTLQKIAVCTFSDLPHLIKTVSNCWASKKRNLWVRSYFSFAKLKSRISILLRIDNTTAVAYINNLGGTVSSELVQLTRSLWMWCLERNIHITAQYLPGSQNVIADAESRVATNRIDWRLNPAIFAKIDHLFGPLKVDLFATRLSTQPLQLAARSLCRSHRCLSPELDSSQGLCQSPWNLIGKAISQVQPQQARIVLVAPVWRTQPWYPILLSTLIDYPRIITPAVEITTSQPPPSMFPQLAVWHISGRDTETNSFLRKLQTSYSTHGGQKPTGPTTHCFQSGVADVLQGIQIPFLDL